MNAVRNRKILPKMLAKSTFVRLERILQYLSDKDKAGYKEIHTYLKDFEYIQYGSLSWVLKLMLMQKTIERTHKFGSAHFEYTLTDFGLSYLGELMVEAPITVWLRYFGKEVTEALNKTLKD